MNPPKRWPLTLDRVLCRQLRQKSHYLTFDCGYENGNTGKILDTLKEKEVPAAFFLNRRLSCLCAGAGEENGPGRPHCRKPYRHPSRHDKILLSGRISKRTDRRRNRLPRDHRQLPGPLLPAASGHLQRQSLEYAKEAGYHTIFWSLAHVDWNQEAQPAWEEMYEKLVRRIHPGAIVLLHSTSQANTEYLGRLIGRMENSGISFRKIQFGT